MCGGRGEVREARGWYRLRKETEGTGGKQPPEDTVDEQQADGGQKLLLATTQHMQTTHTSHTHTHTAVMWVVTCPLDDLHNVGWEVAHTVVSGAVVVDAALPSAIRVLLQHLYTNICLN